MGIKIFHNVTPQPPLCYSESPKKLGSDNPELGTDLQKDKKNKTRTYVKKRNYFQVTNKRFMFFLYENVLLIRDNDHFIGRNYYSPGQRR